jgi:hypothetical protein
VSGFPGAALRSGAALIGMLLLVAGTAGAAATTAPERHDFITSYQKPATTDYGVYYDELRRERFLESVAEELNRVLDLPATVTLTIAECGHSTTSWTAESHTVLVCYEFLDAVLVIAGESGATPERAEQMFSGAVTFALFNEIGRALVSLYDLPAPQGQDRAGDEFAAITLAAAEQEGDPSAAAALEFYDAALRDPESGLEFLETHAFGRSRLENVACILYGNAPGNHAAVREHGLVPPERLPRCGEEVLAVAKLWDVYLKDHTRGGAIPTPPPVSPPPATRL